jgi:uncharacterized membrane protein HdeD (DUF308 family)
MRLVGAVTSLLIGLFAVVAGVALLAEKAFAGNTDAPRGVLIFVGVFFIVCGAAFLWVAVALRPRDR